MEEAMPTYVLPDLDYDFGALEPHISGEVMELHHSAHHRGYVEKANETLEKLDEARAKQDFTRIGAFEKALAFNLSGHVLHSVFWKNLTPGGGGEPRGELGRLITLAFFDAVWNLWNWEDVNARLEAARRLDLHVPDSVGTGAGGGARL